MHGIGYNWVFNWNAEIWGGGAAVAPTLWTVSGAGATVAKNTTAGQFKYGAASVALTRVGTDCFLYQDVDLIADQGAAAAWGSRPVIFGAWVRATVASRARIAVSDGVVSPTYSSYHTGGSTFEFLTVSVTLSASPTLVRVSLYVDTGNTTAQFDGMTLISAPATVKHATQSSVSDLGVATEVGPDEWNADHSLTLTDSIPSGWRGRKCTILCGAKDVQGAGTTSYYGPWGHTATEVDTSFRTPYKGVARNLRVHLNDNVGGAAQTCIATLRSAEATDSTLTVTINTGARAGSNTADEVEYAANTILSMKVVTSATAGGLFVHTAFEFEETP